MICKWIAKDDRRGGFHNACNCFSLMNHRTAFCPSLVDFKREILPAKGFNGRARLLPSLALVRQEPLPPGIINAAARLTIPLEMVIT